MRTRPYPGRTMCTDCPSQGQLRGKDRVEGILKCYEQIAEYQRIDIKSQTLNTKRLTLNAEQIAIPKTIVHEKY